jgi:four helix bundle protein
MSIDDQRKILDFTDLIAWQKAHSLVLTTYTYTKMFPENEKFILMSQMTRAAISITSNIAEGFGRSTAKDKIYFYGIAKGSLLELRSQSHVAKDLEYITIEQFNAYNNDAIEVLRLISGMMRTAHDRE